MNKGTKGRQAVLALLFLIVFWLSLNFAFNSDSLRETMTWYFPSLYIEQHTVSVQEEYWVKVPTQPRLVNRLFLLNRSDSSKCSYSMRGWSKAESALYGVKTCGDKSNDWVFWPMSDFYIHSVRSLPNDIQENPTDISIWQETSLISPQKELDDVTDGMGWVSPYGWWYAFVVEQPYGREDVVVVSSKPILRNSVR